MALSLIFADAVADSFPGFLTHVMAIELESVLDSLCQQTSQRSFVAFCQWIPMKWWMKRGMEAKDIELVMSQAGCTWAAAVKVLKDNMGRSWIGHARRNVCV